VRRRLTSRSPWRFNYKAAAGSIQPAYPVWLITLIKTIGNNFQFSSAKSITLVCAPWFLYYMQDGPLVMQKCVKRINERRIHYAAAAL
jgi:hypothetical protein